MINLAKLFNNHIKSRSHVSGVDGGWMCWCWWGVEGVKPLCSPEIIDVSNINAGNKCAASKLASMLLRFQTQAPAAKGFLDLAALLKIHAYPAFTSGKYKYLPLLHK